jgi:hypothetical protein
MKKTKTYCDICGTEIKKGYGIDKGELKLTGRSSMGKASVDRIIWKDLCHVCTINLFTTLHKFVEVK